LVGHELVLVLAINYTDVNGACMVMFDGGVGYVWGHDMMKPLSENE
jgi:hypothetical protein